MRGLAINTLATGHEEVHECFFFVHLNSTHNTYFLCRCSLVRMISFANTRKKIIEVNRYTLRFHCSEVFDDD